jgi:diguanylate cyclase (GGDEF)-like protein/PAS domain S-box-containing protein
MVEIDAEGTILATNQAMARMLDCPLDELAGRQLHDFVHPMDRDSVIGSRQALLVGEEVRLETERRFVTATGRPGVAEVRVSKLHDPLCPSTRLLLHVMDVTESRNHQIRLGGLARFSSLIENSFDAITITNRKGVVVYANPPLADIFGVSRRAVVGVKVGDALHPDDRIRVRELMATVLDQPGRSATFECRVRHASGAWRHIEVIVSNRLDDAGIDGVVSNIRDVTDRVDIAARMAYQAVHDSMTGLPNRTLFMDRLGHALVRSAQSRRPCAVFYVDVDRFKQINDIFGHVTGDQVLKLVAGRIRHALRVIDTVARVGGDEFVVLVEDVDGPAAALEIGDRIRDSVSRPGVLEGHRLNITCSLGIAISSRSDADALLQEADLALQWAKQSGRDCGELYDREMRVQARRRLDTEVLIRNALDDDQVVVHHQPVVDLHSGLLVGTEALARIRLKSGKLLQPGNFIAVAEESGLIVELGAAVLRQACCHQGAWNRTGDRLHLAVNVSARQLASDRFPAELSAILEATGVAPSMLCLELTESILIDASASTRDRMQELKALGVRFALDDFGTGWSSLAYLRRFPIDVVKIDRSFVKGLGAVKDDTEVVRAVIGLGQSLGLTTVAEGVETEGQHELLVEMGCTLAQGYLYSRPMPASKRPSIRRPDSALASADARVRRVGVDAVGRDSRFDLLGLGLSGAHQAVEDGDDQVGGVGLEVSS